jgi:transcriptional regulator with XRE-family HTH domain
MPQRADLPFGDEVLRLLEVRGLSLRRLATLADVSPGHLSRVMRSADQKALTKDVRQRVAAALNLSPGYFVEDREEDVIERVRADPELRDRLYDEFTRR